MTIINFAGEHKILAEEHHPSVATGVAQHAEQGGPVPGSRQASFIEAGARELRQLYPDASEDMCRLLCQHRLVLVLDLDHTLVNSARQNEVDAEHLQVAISLIHKSYLFMDARFPPIHIVMLPCPPLSHRATCAVKCHCSIEVTSISLPCSCWRQRCAKSVEGSSGALAP